MMNKTTRDTITILVPIVSAILAAIWAVITYFVPGHADRPVDPPVAVQVATPAKGNSSGLLANTAGAPQAAELSASASNVSANNGVAIGGDVSNSTITVSTDPTEE